MSFCEQWKPASAMLAINFAFSLVNLLLKKTIDRGLNHLVIVTYRQAMSTILLTPIAFFWERKSRAEMTPRISCYLFFSALIGVTLTQFLFLLGLQYTSATFSCAFLNMVPVFTFVLALPFGLEKLNLKSIGGCAKLLGTLTCVVGALVLTFYRGMQLTHLHEHQATENHASMTNSPKKAKNWAAGSVLLTAGSLSWSSWFLLQARIGKMFPFQYSSTAIVSFFGAIQSAILSLITERRISMWVLHEKWDIISVVYSGMVGSGLCYVGMSWCVKQKGPVFTSAFTPFTQIFVAFFEVFVMHEPVHLGSLLGSFLVIMGMYTLLWGKSKEIGGVHTKQNQVAEEAEGCSTSAVSQVIPVTINPRSS
ncbi:WAT1-related protein At3g30340 [Humulus lupulus]|uniref:WAT1-related protein At3g30340 n=1 Tax=Humulus lupulus TaxID=3486 RepID=UPI002B40E57D|nr:WAT1-related protein At3g30340 [Humulus lupulus]